MPWLLTMALTWGEIWLLTRAVKRLGVAPVAGYVLLTLVLGISIAVRVGRQALLATRLAAARGQLPPREVMAGVVLGFGGFLLALPGVLTDLIALPILLSAYLLVFKRSYFAVLYTTTIGIGLLGTGIVLLLVGAFWLSRLTKIEV